VVTTPRTRKDADSEEKKSGGKRLRRISRMEEKGGRNPDAKSLFLWDSDCDSRVRKFRTRDSDSGTEKLDSDSDSSTYCVTNDYVLKDDLREILKFF